MKLLAKHVVNDYLEWRFDVGPDNQLLGYQHTNL